MGDGHIFYYQTVMLKSQAILKSPSELLAMQKLFLAEAPPMQQRVVPLELPFYNFVCYTLDLLHHFANTPHPITLNLFLLDHHLRNYTSPTQLHRRFLGFIASWRRHADTDEARLLLSLLGPTRNSRQSVRTFLKLRKVLLKPVGQKVLQEVSLSHEDAVTIVHTMGLVTGQQRRALTKRVNEHFITKNVKYVNNAKFNAAIICQFLMEELNDRTSPATSSPSPQFSSNLTNKINRTMDYQQEEIQEEQSICESPPQSNRITFRRVDCEKEKENVKEEAMHEKSLVSLDQCMRELSILKERDMQIDNRFRRLHLVREDQS